MLSSPIRRCSSPASGHMGVVNLPRSSSWASRRTRRTRRAAVRAGSRRQDPCGYLEENAFIRLSGRWPSPLWSSRCGNVSGPGDLFSHGITLIQDGLTDRSRYAMLSAARLSAEVVGVRGHEVRAGALSAGPSSAATKFFSGWLPQGRTA